MAVHTKLSEAQIAEAIGRYDIGSLTGAAPIQTGIENSNYRIDTEHGRFVLTVFEQRVDPTDLPYFAQLLQHMAEKGIPVPPPLSDRSDERIQTVAGKSAWIVPFLPGRAPEPPSATQAWNAGNALGTMHAATADFRLQRDNDLSLAGWHAMADALGARLETITPGLRTDVDREFAYLDRHWPRDLPLATIHADLFPDNVLMGENSVTGLIDFYFACTDIRAYDLAVTHASWSFSDGGCRHDADIGRALIEGYAQAHALSDAERAALPVLCRGACLRFLLTRATDWFGEGDVHRKDPLAFARRLEFYRTTPELFAS